MRIAGLRRTSLIDYPGMTAAVVFLAGCNYDCFFCHNRGLLEEDCPYLPKSEVMGFLEKREGLIDGVVVSGGEPTLCAELPDFLAEIKSLGFLTKLDTNGGNPDMVSRLVSGGYLDYAAVDYKVPKEDYKKYCGAAASADKVLETADILARGGVRFEVRTTLIPQIGERQLKTMAGELPPLPRYVINRYRIPPAFRVSDEKLIRQSPEIEWNREKILSVLRPFQPGAVVHG